MIYDSEMPMFRSICAKVIPADTDAASKAMIEQLVVVAIEVTHENGTPKGTEAAVLESVKLAFEEMRRGLRESGSVWEKDALGFPIRCAARTRDGGKIHICSRPDGHKLEHKDGASGHTWLDCAGGAFKVTIEMVPAPSAVPVVNEDQPSLLEKPQCPSMVRLEDVGPRVGTQRCSLQPGHREKHHDKTTGWFWEVATDGTVYMSKPGEEKET